MIVEALSIAAKQYLPPYPQKDWLKRFVSMSLAALAGNVGTHLCTFDQLKDSGYYQSSVQHIFVDNVVTVASKRARLNHEAQEYIWAFPSEALQHLDIEPNARTTIERYVGQPMSRPTL